MARKAADLARYLLVQLVGAFLMVLGVLGLVLPVLNGLIPLAVGAVLIAMYNPSLHRFIQRLVERLPFLEEVFEKTEVFLEKFFGPAPDGTPPIRSGFPHYKQSHHKDYGHSAEE